MSTIKDNDNDNKKVYEYRYGSAFRDVNLAKLERPNTPSTIYDCVLCEDMDNNDDKRLLRKHMITSHYYGDLVDWVIESIIESDDDYPEND